MSEVLEMIRRTRPQPKVKAPEPDPRDVRIDKIASAVKESIDTQRSILEYLKMPHEERAKKEAGELLEKERQAREQERLAREQAEVNAVRLQNQFQEELRRQKESAQKLRDVIGSTQDETERLRVELGKQNAEVERLRAEVKKKPAKEIVRETVNVQPLLLSLDDIQFQYQRRENGLLHNVVLKAKGYRDVTVEIERGADNRMRNLKVR